MSKLTWLHLSDLHFRPGERHTWDENIVLRALLNDVQERITSDGLRPAFIAVSGDIAFSGKAEEYDLARRFFDELLETTGLTKDRLLVVPGNHDVDRSTITWGAVAIASSLDNRQAIDEVLANAVDRRLLFRRLSAYADFINDYLASHLTFDDEHYFYVKPLDLVGQRVAVLGLNSAWLSASDEDRGRLALGERQVRQALEASRDAELRIALLHHPFDWLREFDRDDCEALLMDGCDFILHGHLHRAGLLSLKTPDAGAMLVAAGACYETRHYPNGYNWVQLDLEAGQGTVYLRTYSDQRGGFWTKDVQTYKNVDDGKFTFLLPSPTKAVPKKKKRQPSLVAPAKLEASYLRRVQTLCNALPLAVIDPRAVERTRQQTMDLLPLYVTLYTKTPVAVEGEMEEKGKRRRPKGMMEPGHETRPLSALEAAASERQMVLLGDPGSGKSTFANYLALCLAGARLERLGETGVLPGDQWLAHLEPAWTHSPLLSLQLTLRQFAKSEWCNGTADGLWSFIAETLDTQGLTDFAPHLRQQLFDGGVLVLLDGLDEVADPGQRQAVRDAVADLTATFSHSANRYLVTCRGYAYQDLCCQLDRFVVHTLAPFNQEQIDAFIGCWYNEVCRLGWKNETEAKDLTQWLQEATRRPDLAPLATSPLQLAMMASLHFSWGRLPDDRVELYQEMVRLLLVRWQEARLGQETGVTQTVSIGELESALERVAFVAHRAQAGAEGTADISEAMLRSVLKDYLEGSWDRAGEMVSFIQDRAGLLIDRGKGTYTFPHRSYQEYLAGSYLAVQPDFPDEAASLARENYAQWREVTLWAVGVMARSKKMIHIAVDVAAALCPRDAPDQAVPETDWRVAHLAGEALLEIGLKDVQARERHRPVLARVQGWLAALVEQGVLTPADRAEAGQTLGVLGDPRPGVGLRPDGLPDIAWCEVPAGLFLMGSDKARDPDAYDAESPQHEQPIPDAYRISQYPITNAQFAAFAGAGGYAELIYWREAKEVGVWSNDQVKAWNDDEPRAAPYDFGVPFNLPNHPVVGVTWYEAVAFCRWLTERLREAGEIGPEQGVTLPTEAQWEKAARGEDGRIFPWGDEFDAAKCNMGETGIGTTSTVGMFPTGASPYGVQDLSGNVWEWTQSLWGEEWDKAAFKYPYDPKDGREDIDAPAGVRRVVRGGSFSFIRYFARCAGRYRFNPDFRYRFFGFRLVVSPVSPSSAL
jgi:formylglycine-generating enzyme required for sulfatase activity